MIICNFILFKTAFTEFYSYFSPKSNEGVIIWLDAVIALIFSSEKPLDFQKNRYFAIINTNNPFKIFVNWLKYKIN